MTRPEWPDRRICQIETKNWREFSAPVLTLQADADDRALAQHYGMYVLPYHGHFVGLLWVFYAGDAALTMQPHRYRGGKLETYLAYSNNGTHWQRCTHTPLFVNGDAGSPDAGCLQVSNIVVADDGQLRAFAACSTNEHGICPPDDGHIVSYDLRKDGFVCLESQADPGVVSTRALYWRNGEAQLNIDATHGRVRVKVIEARGKPIDGFEFDDCVPFSSDSVDYIPQWKNGRKLDQLSGRMLRIEIEMTSAKLYAIRGDFTQCHLLGLQRWEKNGIIPEATRPV